MRKRKKPLKCYNDNKHYIKLRVCGDPLTVLPRKNNIK